MMILASPKQWRLCQTEEPLLHVKAAAVNPRSGVRIYLRNTQKVQLKCISTGMRYSGASSGPQLPEPMPLW